MDPEGYRSHGRFSQGCLSFPVYVDPVLVQVFFIWFPSCLHSLLLLLYTHSCCYPSIRTLSFLFKSSVKFLLPIGSSPNVLGYNKRPYTIWPKLWPIRIEDNLVPAFFLSLIPSPSLISWAPLYIHSSLISSSALWFQSLCSAIASA